MPGKADWLARGLPREGETASEPRAADYAHLDVVTCGPGDAAAALRAAIDASTYGFALVLGCGDMVLGRVRRSTLDAAGDATAEALMEPGPSTVRADAAPHSLRDRLERGGYRTAVITDPDGRLLGVVRRADLPAPQDARGADSR